MFTDKSGTKWEILETLRESGESSVKNLESELDLSPSTLNEHLTDLRAMDLLEKRSDRDGPGRPRHLYFLTDEAESLFPHGYSKLASLLMDVVKSLIDEPHAREKLAEVLSDHYEEYDNLENALEAIGFYPEFSDEDGQTTIRYNQCPFLEVAREDSSLCDIDKAVLEEMTGRSARMEECIVTGSSCCEFVLSEN